MKPEIWENFLYIMKVTSSNTQHKILSHGRILRFQVKILPDISGFN